MKNEATVVLGLLNSGAFGVKRPCLFGRRNSDPSTIALKSDDLFKGAL